MAILRERPYGQFNFLVDLGDGNTEGPQAGFQEVSGIGMEVVVIGEEKDVRNHFPQSHNGGKVLQPAAATPSGLLSARAAPEPVEAV